VPPVTTSQSVGPVAGTSAAFSIRPVLCFAPPFTPGAVPQAAGGPLPTCAPSSALTPSNLRVTPDSGTVDGYTSNSQIAADPQFAIYPSTPAGSVGNNATVLLPGSPGAGTDRYVLGPAALTGTSVRAAHVQDIDGQWTVDLQLTGSGSARWDALARQQFHAIVGVVFGGMVVSAPITQPTQTAFSSFDGRLQVSGGLSEHQAEAVAAALR